jgi:hypothetical protein
MSAIPPTRHSRRANAPIAAAAIGALSLTTAALVAGCTSEPSLGGLLVATGGPLHVTDASGAIVPFDGPADPVVAVSASVGHVVAVTAAGSFTASDGSSGTRTWRAIDVPPAEAGDVRLMAVSPLGRELAVVIGAPQGAAFDLVVIDVGLGQSRSIAVDRGLNGPPAWIGAGTIAIDVIKPDGESGMAAIDSRSGAVSDDAIDGRVVSATDDRRHLAVDDPANGDVLVGVLDGQALKPLTQVKRLGGPAGSAVDVLSISRDGGCLALVRRTEAGAASIEIDRALDQGWRSVKLLAVTGDGPVSIAWLQ